MGVIALLFEYRFSVLYPPLFNCMTIIKDVICGVVELYCLMLRGMSNI